MKNEEIDSLRQFLGTLPARTNEEEWLEPEYVRGISRLEVIPASPEPRPSVIKDQYKAMFTMATSTWGDGNIDGNWHCKWENVEPSARFLVIWNVLHRNTLPTAMEANKFTFEILGGQRHFFDQAARSRLGSGFASIGCRDNSKLASEFVLYSNLYDMMKDPQTPEEEKVAKVLPEAFKAVKEAYKAILDCGKGSYQIARAILPLSYHHQFSATYNLLSLMGMFGRRSCLGEEEPIVSFAWQVRRLLNDTYGMHMVGDVMRIPCYRSKRCFYAGSMHGYGGLAFSNLFSPKDPVCRQFVPEDYPDYAEFNESCTSSAELDKYDVGFMRPEDYIDIPPDYKEAKKYLSDWEIKVFEE